jgi:hypothetical protein
MYKAVVQAVLLYGAETWMLTGAMEKAHQSFHRKCARYVTGKHIRPDPNDIEGKTWICPSSAGVLEEIGLLPIQQYILQKRAMLQNYISSRPIYGQCLHSRAIVRHSRQSVWRKHQMEESQT